MNEIKQDLESTPDCVDRKATRLEKCMYSLVDINTRIDNLNSRHYYLLKKLDVDYDDGSVCKEPEPEPEPEVSTGLLRDIESIINEINFKINISEKKLILLDEFI